MNIESVPNVSEPQANLEVGNTVTTSKSRRWALTLNNWNETQYTHIKQSFSNYLWIIGKEISESGTPHLQIYIEAKNAISFKTLKNICSGFHIEKAIAKRQNNLIYCSKGGNFETNFETIVTPPVQLIKDPLEGKNLYPFQQRIIDEIQEEPNDRKILWIHEGRGNVGKTSLAKHLCVKYPNEVLFVNGKASDIKYAVTSFINNKKNNLKVCLFHFTRTMEDYISYSAIEEIKDGIFFSSKYESQTCIFNTPHIICLSNFPPEVNKLSIDRWEIIEIELKN